jgi:SAM-dependent methyltransferase
VLAERDATVRLCGVDPSVLMLEQARRRLAGTNTDAAPGRDLRVGVAGALPFADRSFDHVVAVNTAAMWPDLAAGIADAHRVLRPGGCLLLAWHSAAGPNRLRRRLARPKSWWATVLEVVRDEFGNAERHDLRYTTACTATRAA